MNVVSDTQLARYINTYLRTLLEEIAKLSKEHQLLFEIQKEQPMRCLGFISQKHGAAVAFLPSNEESTEVKYAPDRIESIFPKDPNTGDTLLQVEVGPRKTFTSVWRIDTNLAFKKARFLQRKKDLAILSKGLKLTVDEDSTYIIEDRLILKGTNNPEKWSEDVAIKDAFYEILRTLINKERKEVLPRDLLEDLGSRVKNFEVMIKSPESKELELQKFFESSPEFLYLGSVYSKIYPQILLKKTNGDLKPDFFLERVADGYCDILDIKLPHERLIVGSPSRRKFASHVESAIAQVDEYRGFFDETRNREQVRKEYGIKVYKPKCYVLIGKDEFPEERIKINNRYSGVEIITYDHILKHIRQFLEKLQKYGQTQ